MSGEKRYRTSPQVVARVARQAEARAAAAAARAAEQARIREERLRREEMERQAERMRLRKIAEAKAAEEERERQRNIAAEIQAIVTGCEVEMKGMQADNRFSCEEVQNALAKMQMEASTKTDVAAIRKMAEVFKAELASHLAAVDEFKQVAAECNDVLSGTAAEKAVRLFKSDRIRELAERHKVIVSSGSLKELAIEKSCEKIREITGAANELVVASCKLEAEYESRNQLLEATISALKGMGFYVTDPTFLNADDPIGPVAITATRGPERIVISVPLAGEVVSDWQGLPEGVCVGDFGSFLKKLEENGFPCETTDPRLIAPSKLIKKGAKTLPGQVDDKRSV